MQCSRSQLLLSISVTRFQEPFTPCTMSRHHYVSPPRSQASEGSSFTHISFSSANPDLARVFVQFSNGMKTVIPVPHTSTVQDLHAEALQRAARVGLAGTLDNTLLQTTGENRVILYGEDSLIGILDLTKNNTFCLQSRDTTSSSFANTNYD